MSGRQRKENANANTSMRKSIQKPQNREVDQNVERMNDSVDMLDDADVLDDETGGTRIGDIYIPPPVPAHCSQESKGPRLIIKNIFNQNFKSYAGEVVLGPFHHCFTAIIGPNGSGKSNVIDSMLFVFGYRANKIRCKKLSTLIHNSSEFPNLQKCSVAVHFEEVVDIPNSDKCNRVPESRIVVERTAHRDNSSYYTINNRRVQFKEVAKLLKEHSVDLDHNRFLILQGEVESIAMMKPKAQNENDSGMLEYLEDIVGTTRYIMPLQLILQRVEKLTEERTEKHNRCKLSEREMHDLEKPFNEAVAYLRLENEHTRTKNLRIQKYLCEKNKKLEEYTKEHERVVAILKEHDDAAEQLKKEREEKEQMIRKELDEFEALRKNKENFEKQLEKTKSKHTEVVKTMEITNDRRKNNKKQITQNETKLESLQKVPEKNRKEIEECEKKIERLNKDKAKFEEELQTNYAQLHVQTKPLIEKREKLETELLEIDINQPKGDLACLESQLKILKNDETMEARKYHSLKSAYEESQKSQSEKKALVEEITMKIPEINKEIATKSNELKKLENDEQNLQAHLNKIRAEIRERTSSIQNQRSNNQVLDLMMRLKAEGKLPGVLGRLGNLGGIESKYDVAISTACGRLDNIVVDTVDTAQQCIEMLKKYNAGRGTFIALEKVAHLAGQMHPINTPENVPRLFDLVNVEDERVRPAFYFSLRDTLVCDNLDQGTRIGYGKKRYRVVTLKGEIIEQSGTMSGGGGRPIRGKMGTRVQTKTSKSADSSISQKDLEDMQMQAEELQSKVNFGQEEQGRLEREVHQLKTQLQKYDTEIKHLNIALKSLEQQLPSSFKQMEAQRQRMEQKTANPQKVQELEQKIAAAMKRVEAAENEAGKVSKKIDEIKTQIDGIHGDKVKSVQTKINGVANQIKKLNTHVSKLNVEITTSERDIVKIEQQTENLKAEIEKAQNELRSLNTQHSELLGEKTKLEQEVEEAQKAISNAKSQSSDIQKEVHKLQKLESDNKLKRVEIEVKVQTVASQMNDVKSQIPHWRQELKPLKLNEIPGDTEPLQPLKTYTDEELGTYSLQDLQYKESVQDEQLKQKPNLSCIDEFINKREVYLERVKVLEDITSKRNEMRDKYEEVRKRRYTEFMDGFRVITRKLKEMYQMITQGGDAELELVDSMDPFTEGVSFSVRPPKKTWKNISNLSGGEKTLSSLALVFALHYYKPSPLYFMDEIDAALDFKNVSIVAHYIKERTKNAQFIIVSLRSNMFELSNFLVGIYKINDCTNTICIKNTPPISLALSKVTNNMQLFEQTLSLMSQMQTQTQTQRSPTHFAKTVADENNENVPPGQSQTGNFRILSPQRQNVDLTLTVPAQTQTQGRETTFAPPAESTAIAQTIESTISRPTGLAVVPTSRPSESAPTQDTSQAAENNRTTHLSQGRETTFAPNLESTALPQAEPDVTRRPTVDDDDATFKKPNPPATNI